MKCIRPQGTTPGPWKNAKSVTEIPDNETRTRYGIFGGGDTLVVGELISKLKDGNTLFEETRWPSIADNRLITAAPDLYDALYHVYEYISFMPQAHGIELVKLVKKALDKAGEPEA